MRTELCCLVHMFLELEPVQNFFFDPHEFGPTPDGNGIPFMTLGARFVTADGVLTVPDGLQDQLLLPGCVTSRAQRGPIQVNGFAQSPQKLGILTQLEKGELNHI